MDEAVTAFVTLFVIVDPVGTTPLFIALTAGLGGRERARVALRSLLVAFGVLLLFGLAGEAVLAFVGISMPAFRIAGGLLLFLTAIDMLFERRTERRERRVAEEVEGDGAGPDDPSVFPLAIPLIAGPGAIAAMILLTGEAGADAAAQGVVFAVMAGVLLLQYVLFRLAGPVGRLLGRTGIMVVTRLMGMLLAALAVQFVIDGVAGLVPALLPGRASG
jgi:multiple antibiotic resistance protein